MTTGRTLDQIAPKSYFKALMGFFGAFSVYTRFARRWVRTAAVERSESCAAGLGPVWPCVVCLERRAARDVAPRGRTPARNARSARSAGAAAGRARRVRRRKVRRAGAEDVVASERERYSHWCSAARDETSGRVHLGALSRHWSRRRRVARLFTGGIVHWRGPTRGDTASAGSGRL